MTPEEIKELIEREKAKLKQVPSLRHTEILVPFLEDGSVPWEYPTDEEEGKIEWKPNKPFKAKIEYYIIIFERNGDPRLSFRDTKTGGYYPVRLLDLGRILKKRDAKKGVMSGKWMFWEEGGKVSLIPAK